MTRKITIAGTSLSGAHPKTNHVAKNASFLLLCHHTTLDDFCVIKFIQSNLMLSYVQNQRLIKWKKNSSLMNNGVGCQNQNKEIFDFALIATSNMKKTLFLLCNVCVCVSYLKEKKWEICWIVVFCGKTKER